MNNNDMLQHAQATLHKVSRQNWIALGAALMLLLLSLVLVRHKASTNIANIVNATPNVAATTTAVAIPTATAAAVHATQTAITAASYSAAIPGDCDKNPQGDWELLQAPTDASLTCNGNSVTLTQPSTSIFVAEDQFRWKGHPFGDTYTIQVNVSDLTRTDTSAVVCGGLLTHIVLDQSYGYYICNDSNLDYWYEYIYDVKGNPTLVTYGSMQQAATYHLEVVEQGNQHIFRVNGVTLNTRTDATISGTSWVSLGSTSGSKNVGASARFDSFELTPLALSS